MSKNNLSKCEPDKLGKPEVSNISLESISFNNDMSKSNLFISEKKLNKVYHSNNNLNSNNRSNKNNKVSQK